MTQRRNHLLIVSGLSGSGKTVALRALEDLGYFSVDNLPCALLPDLARSTVISQPDRYPRLAVGIDARNRGARCFADLGSQLDALREQGVLVEVVFLDAADAVLIRRFSETRRRHPLTLGESPLDEAIASERQLLANLAEAADVYIDTSDLNVHELRRQVNGRYGGAAGMTLELQSFAFKHGVPRNSDFVFDLRALPNPYWQPDLREQTGRDEGVRTFLGQQADVQAVRSDLLALLQRWLPQFEAENRSYLTVSLGCTGGRHRSVFMVESLAAELRKDYPMLLVEHRELS